MIRIDNEWVLTKLRDISGGGVAIQWVPGAVRGEFVMLRLSVGTTTYSFPGQVRWLNEEEVGLAFVGLPTRQSLSRQTVAKGPSARRSERFGVELSVSYSVAGEFIQEYADNLSCGGLFIVGAHKLELLSRVKINLQIPGCSSVGLVAEVVHVLPPDQALASNRRPGAGLEIVDTSVEAMMALTRYLGTLMRRKEFMVLAEQALWQQPLRNAGYQSAQSSCSSVASQLALHKQTLAGLVVPRAHLEEYAQAAKQLGIEDVVIGADAIGELNQVVAQIDSRFRG